MRKPYESQEITAKNNPDRLEPGSPYAPCVRCLSKATWEINGYPYCEKCGPVRRRWLLDHEGLSSSFHSPTGFVWAESGLYPADFSKSDQ